jgi:hypothetical protein
VEATHYALLELERSADAATITDAFRRLAFRLQRDMPGGPEVDRRMRQLIEAYRVLGDPARRAAYDQQLGGREPGASRLAWVKPVGGSLSRRLAETTSMVRVHDDGPAAPERRVRMPVRAETRRMLEEAAPRFERAIETRQPAPVLVWATPAAASIALPAMPTDRPLSRRMTETRSEGPVAVIDFGRYAGWPLSRIRREDPEYLRWLARTPAGRHLRAAIKELLGPLD